MILDISDSAFKKIFNDENLFLPIRWTGDVFYDYLENLFNEYQKKIKDNVDNYRQIAVRTNKICNLVLESVKHYLNGFPSRAYETFTSVMEILMGNPLRVYYKSAHGPIQGYSDKLDLFRVASVKENIKYERKRLFHTPYNLRSKVATCRYSIAGYPSLYLGTDLELCCEEVQYDPHSAFGIASRFRIERDFDFNDTEIRVIELAIKPQDFFERENREDRIGRSFNEIDLYNDANVKNAYFLWYPVIAACSFIRANKSDPFAAEYIVPQLLMQWVRSESSRCCRDEYCKERCCNLGCGCVELIGVRYFSCASERASDLGFNYVFPVSGDEYSKEFPFCPVLMKSFKMTKPYFINNYMSIHTCEYEMKKDQDLKFLDEV